MIFSAARAWNSPDVGFSNLPLCPSGICIYIKEYFCRVLIFKL
jgi:hypothetical protein